jgi:hypothetical protein
MHISEIILFFVLFLIAVTALALSIFYTPKSKKINVLYEQNIYSSNTFTGALLNETVGYTLSTGVPFTIPFETTVGELVGYDKYNGIYTVPDQYSFQPMTIRSEIVVFLAGNAQYAFELSLVATDRNGVVSFLARTPHAGTANDNTLSTTLEYVGVFEAGSQFTVQAISTQATTVIKFVYSTENIHEFTIVAPQVAITTLVD